MVVLGCSAGLFRLPDTRFPSMTAPTVCARGSRRRIVRCRTPPSSRLCGCSRCGPTNVFVDFGCGDGRLVEAATGRCRLAIGVELDPILVVAARRRLRGSPGAWRILHEPLGWTPMCEATCGVLHLLPVADTFFLREIAPSLPLGFRLLTVGRSFPGGRAVAAAVVGAPPQVVRLCVSRLLNRPPYACHVHGKE